MKRLIVLTEEVALKKNLKQTGSSLLSPSMMATTSRLWVAVLELHSYFQFWLKWLNNRRPKLGLKTMLRTNASLEKSRMATCTCITLKMSKNSQSILKNQRDGNSLISQKWAINHSQQSHLQSDIKYLIFTRTLSISKIYWPKLRSALIFPNLSILSLIMELFAQRLVKRSKEAVDTMQVTWT